jgi:amino acid adenylation domain-containing protein
MFDTKKSPTTRGRAAVAAKSNTKEREYWLQKLSGPIPRCFFPYDYKNSSTSFILDEAFFQFSQKAYSLLMGIKNHTDYTLHIYLTACSAVLLQNYCHGSNINLGTPIYKQEQEGDFINTILPLIFQLEPKMTFKDLLFQVRQTIMEAIEHQNYPVEIMTTELGLTQLEDDFTLFSAAVCLENIHYRKYLQHLQIPIQFSFLRTETGMEVSIEYDSSRYERITVKRIFHHYQHLLEQMLENVERHIIDIDILLPEEKEQLLYEFNNTGSLYPDHLTIDELFEQQVEQLPDGIALISGNVFMTYRQLNRRANRLAWLLRIKGALPGGMVGIILERSPRIFEVMLAILKVGNSYLPIDTMNPQKRTVSILDDARVPLLITDTPSVGDHSLIDLQGLREEQMIPLVTGNRPRITGLNGLPVPNRSPVDYPEPGTAVHKWSRQLLLLDQLEEVLINQETTNPGNRQHSADDYAYSIYTSGSTGVPRGTLTTHANVTRVVKNTNYLELTPSDRVLQLSNYAFDGSVFDIYGALLNGGGLVSVSREELIEVQRLAILIEKQGIDVFFVTTALFNTLVDLGLQRLSRVKKILFGGERVSLEHTKRAGEYLGNGHIIHMYGPTETTVFATYHPVNKPDERLGTVPIGGPLANTEIYILDERQKPVPIGVEGEIYIGGKGLAVGYLNRPDLTAQHFIESNDIHKTINKKRLYRTGDLARWLWDGTIEFLDRKDKQVKLRGFRIELGEIEIHLLNHPAVREVVVIAREDEQKDKYLCAYLVTAEQIEITSIKEYLAGLLPGFMIPSYFVLLPQIPLNANGKINMALLPDPFSSDPLSQPSREETSRLNPLESRLAEIWAKVLGLKVSEIARDGDFFELGGHSLKATLLLSMIHKELKVKVPVQEIFRTPTIREIAEYISKTSLISYEVIPTAEKKEYYPISSVQKRMYFMQQMQTGSKSYNIRTVVILEGKIDRKKLNNTFQSLLARHESFRTSFVVIDGEVVQVIHEDLEFMVEYYEDKEENVKKTVENFLRPFVLLKAPLLRVGLIKIMEDRHILMVDMHHIISDGVSHEILVKEFSQLYSGDRLAPSRINYKDFSEWQNKRLASGDMNRQKDYWLSKFKKGDMPTLNMPLDYPRPSVRDIDAGGHVSFSLDTILYEKMNTLMKKTGTTLSMMLVAVYNVLLYHYTKQEDIIIGVVITGRTHADLENVIGMFVNTVPIRNYPKRNKRFSEFLAEVKKSMLSAFENQDYPFDELVIRLGLQGVTNKNPLFDVAFNLNNIESSKIKPTDLVIKPYDRDNEWAKFDIALYVNEIHQPISFIFRYWTQLFKPSTMEKLKIYFSEIIDQVVNNVDIKLKDITLSHGFAETKSSFYKENQQAFNL